MAIPVMDLVSNKWTTETIQEPFYQGNNAPKGRVYVYNQCQRDYSVFPVHSGMSHDQQQMAFPVEAHSNVTFPLVVPMLRNGTEYGGVSIKVWTNPEKQGPLLQFEYTPVRNTSELYFNLSFVDCVKKHKAELGEDTSRYLASTDSTDVPIPSWTGEEWEGYRVFDATECPAWSQGIKAYATNATTDDAGAANAGMAKPLAGMECGAESFCPKDAYFEPMPLNRGENRRPEPVARIGGLETDDLHFVLCSDAQSNGNDLFFQSTSANLGPGLAYTGGNPPLHVGSTTPASGIYDLSSA